MVNFVGLTTREKCVFSSADLKVDVGMNTTEFFLAMLLEIVECPSEKPLKGIIFLPEGKVMWMFWFLSALFLRFILYMHPPLASPHSSPATPSVSPVQGGVWGYWAYGYALVCIALSGASVYFAFGFTREAFALFYSFQCGTGRTDAFMRMACAPFSCLLPLLQVIFVNEKLCGTGLYRLMRCGVVIAFVISIALVGGLMILNYFRNELR
ncbi:hypothetical protein IAD21_06385 [Abditibacteriota bacterium]|nr:hypothetical protein IAD21_06385 [Abditibacteriota bacterium]